MVEQLQLDNQRWLSRDPELLAGKLAKMAADPYDYMRGTATVGVNDWTRADADREPTAFVSVRGTESVLLAGDPHPENIGTLHPGGELLLLEVNDFDGATFGPFVWDVRRGLTGLGALVAPTCDDPCLDGALEAYARGYVEGVLAPDRLPRGFRRGQPMPAVLDDLVTKATEEGSTGELEREELELRDDWRWVRDPTLDPTGSGDLRLTVEEQLQVDRLAAALDLDVVDAVRRYGRGVASLPAVRYLVLVRDGESLAMRELREVIDPLPLPGWRATLDGGFEDNAQRVVEVSRTLWARPDADPGLGGATDGAMAFKMTTMSGYQQGFSHTRIADRVLDGRFTADDLATWAHLLGQQLARVHVDAPTREGDRAGVGIAAAIEGREDVFVDEQVQAARDALLDLERDHRLFRSALQRLGPTLGMN